MSPRHYIGLGDEDNGMALRLAEGQQIGVLRSFKIERSTPTHRVYHLPENVVYEVPERVVYEIPVDRVWINEAGLRAALLDSEYDDAPPRSHTPSKGSESGSNR